MDEPELSKTAKAIETAAAAVEKKAEASLLGWIAAHPRPVMAGVAIAAMIAVIAFHLR